LYGGTLKVELWFSELHHGSLALTQILKVDDLAIIGFAAIGAILVSVDRKLVKTSLADCCDRGFLLVAAEEV
jgi:hypothetical protein